MNPECRLDLGRRPFETIAECDFITPEAMSRNPFYEEFLKPADALFTCMARLGQLEGSDYYAISLRSAGQGHIGQDERRAFLSLLPALDASLRLQIRLAGRIDSIALASLESLGLAAVLCDRSGRVAACSAQADQRLLRGNHLTTVGGRLRASIGDDDDELQAALRRVSWDPPATVPASVFVRATGDAPPLRLTVAESPGQLTKAAKI